MRRLTVLLVLARLLLRGESIRPQENGVGATHVVSFSSWMWVHSRQRIHRRVLPAPRFSLSRRLPTEPLPGASPITMLAAPGRPGDSDAAPAGAAPGCLPSRCESACPGQRGPCPAGLDERRGQLVAAQQGRRRARIADVNSGVLGVAGLAEGLALVVDTEALPAIVLMAATARAVSLGAAKYMPRWPPVRGAAGRHPRRAVPAPVEPRRGTGQPAQHFQDRGQRKTFSSSRSSTPRTP